MVYFGTDVFLCEPLSARIRFRRRDGTFLVHHIQAIVTIDTAGRSKNKSRLVLETEIYNGFGCGDVDVINTTLQLILPCLDQVNVLASIGSERISLTPDTPTVAELAPSLDVALWNGLFVHKDTPQDIRDKIIAVASKTVMSNRAQELAEQTGALVYWEPANEVFGQISKDIDTLAGIEAMLQ